MDNDNNFETATVKVEKDGKIDGSIKRISKVLNILEGTTESLEYTCEKHGWDIGVVCQIQDAATKLGYALATLNRWYDVMDSNQS